jgi:hypothetical protein
MDIAVFTPVEDRRGGIKNRAGSSGPAPEPHR